MCDSTNNNHQVVSFSLQIRVSEKENGELRLMLSVLKRFSLMSKVLSVIEWPSNVELLENGNTTTTLYIVSGSVRPKSLPSRESILHCQVSVRSFHPCGHL